MSRIIVKNLPKNITQDKLREYFASKGEVTDVHMKHDKNGKFRNFAYIGFKAESQATDAVTTLDKTYMDSCKLIVEPCSQEAIPFEEKFELKRKAKEMKNSSEAKKKPEKKPKKPKIDPFEEFKDDPSFAEFLEVQRNVGEKKALWADDNPMSKNHNSDVEKGDSGHESSISENHEDLPKKSPQAKPKKDSEYTVKVSGLPYKCKKSHLKKFFNPSPLGSVRMPPKVNGIAYVSFKTEADLKQGLVKHRSFIDGKRIDVKLFKKTTSEPNALNKDVNKKDYKTTDETIAESGRMFVRNLAYSCSIEDLEGLFGKFGEIAELHLPIDKATKKIKGFAFVSFVFPEHAVKAYDELDKTPFQGRLLHLIAAQSKPEGHTAGLKSDVSSFKEKQQKEKKDEANLSKNWNTLFLGADAVAEVMAEKFGVSKTDLVANTDTKGSVAVRMALGETQLVNETRKFLLDNDVNLTAFDEEEPKRSKNIIIVKNLPAKTTSDEIQEMFTKFGSVTRVIMPPYGITAIVDMQERTEAKIAFKKLAYSNFKQQPLYLEWAPANLFRSPSEEQAQDKTVQSDPGDGNKSGAEPGEGCSLFVKNISFETNDEDFEAHFKKYGKLGSVKLCRHRDGSGLSMGYGFVEYKEASSAQKALKAVHNSTLDDHCLQVSLSRNVKKDQQKSSSKQGASQEEEKKQHPSSSAATATTKMVVRNVPFEAKPSEVEELFRAFGELKSVRLPKKLSGDHRGFGFVEFVTRHDAERAIEALSGSTHLYGRRLVLEWAKSSEEEDK
ncbi:putative RNA-binding protein 19 [Halotydeus destructor]|nr:putative RNA-binding protein 19 [Halotydeus destructor]